MGGAKKETLILLRKYGNTCHLCGKEMKPEEMTKDHLIPKSRYKELGIKGSCKGNIRLAHYLCNKKKGNEIII